MTQYEVKVDLGPLEAILEDGDVTEVMVNGMDGVYIEKRGKLIKTDAQFKSNEHIVQVISSILAMAGVIIDPEHYPVVDVRLADGSRVNAVFPPVSLTGPTLTILKYQKRLWGWDDLIGFGSLNQKIVDFLRACVIAKRNIIVAGGTGSGKTTIMNALTEFIPHDERVATVEKTTELQVRHPHLIMLEARPVNHEGKGAITVADLISNVGRMRVDRILTSEFATDGGWEMLQAMNSGHDGSMFTMHATSPLDALERLEMTIAMGGTALPLMQIRQQIASAVSVIVQQMRLPDGKRRIVSITEVTGVRNGVIDMQNIFEFVYHEGENGQIIGEFKATGYKPTFLKHLEYAGVGLPEGFFE
jgi:pilus assembly protein CpaF